MGNSAALASRLTTSMLCRLTGRIRTSASRYEPSSDDAAPRRSRLRRHRGIMSHERGKRIGGEPRAMHQLPRGFDRREHLILTRGHQRRPRRLRHRHAQRRYPRAGLGLEPEPGVPRGTRSEPEPGKQGRRKSLRPRGFAGETTRDGRRRTRERHVRETDRRARRRRRTKIHPSRAARGRRRTFGFRFRLGFGFGAGSRLGRFRLSRDARARLGVSKRHLGQRTRIRDPRSRDPRSRTRRLRSIERALACGPRVWARDAVPSRILARRVPKRASGDQG